MIPLQAGKPPAPNPNQPDAAADAAASLAPHSTRHGHRPDWRAAVDDEAEARRDLQNEG